MHTLRFGYLNKFLSSFEVTSRCKVANFVDIAIVFHTLHYGSYLTVAYLCEFKVIQIT